MRIRHGILAILLAAALGTHALSEVIDRIVAVIGGKVIITQSDVRKERRLLLALGKDAGTDEIILRDLIDRRLLAEQIEQFAGIQVSDEAINARLAEVRNPGDLSSEDLRSAVVSEIGRTEFIIQRFRQFIRVSDEEVNNYYQNVFGPAVRAKNLPVPPLETVTIDIQRTIVSEKLENELSGWLENLRRRNDVEIF
jgi:parvulin-like peptidyl-prolyl isomerase